VPVQQQEADRERDGTGNTAAYGGVARDGGTGIASSVVKRIESVR
jgi:hypothetical protein